MSETDSGNTQGATANAVASSAVVCAERPIRYDLKQIGGAVWANREGKWFGPFGSRAKAHKAMTHTVKAEQSPVETPPNTIL
jgi:hypothetical protein